MMSIRGIKIHTTYSIETLINKAGHEEKISLISIR
jgi:hypothetical protein